jgi:PAS domain S-box-containing protein/putative nucleotidyltransferase with HDIG domain
MDRARRTVLIPALEVALTVLATVVAFYLGVRYDVVDALATFSSRIGFPVDVAEFGPGLFVLSCGLGLMSARRWKEAVDARRSLERTRNVLADSESRYRSLVEVAPAPILLIDSFLRIIFANEAALRLVRASDRASLEGLPLMQIVHRDSLSRVKERTAALLRGERLPAEEIRLRRLDGTDVVVQLLSVPVTIEGSPAIQSVLLDITHLTEMADALQRACIDTVEAMARLAETRDPYTAGHQARVSKIAMAMARHMGLPDASVQAVRIAGIVHDIGKINVPVEILSKPGSLTDVEFALIQTHAELGYEILSPIEFPWPVADLVRQHHERLDGSGYPRGLTGGQILLESRILAVADTIEAVASDRPYRAALGLNSALGVIRDGSGTIFDPACVEACEAVALQILAIPAQS